MTQQLDIIAETREFWKNKTGKEFSEEEARQAIENICGYFEILHEWAKAEEEAEIQDESDFQTS